MFAVVNHLYLNKPVDELREPLQNEGLAVLQAQPGFRDLYLVKAADDHAIVVLLWETGADAQNGASVFGPTWFAKNIAPHLKAEQQRSVGPIIAGTHV